MNLRVGLLDLKQLKNVALSLKMTKLEVVNKYKLLLSLVNLNKNPFSDLSYTPVLEKCNNYHYFFHFMFVAVDSRDGVNASKSNL